MDNRIVTVDSRDWTSPRHGLVPDLEAGRVLFFPELRFELTSEEAGLLRPDVRDEKARNISLRLDGVLAGAAVQGEERARLAAMIGRFRARACSLIDAIAPTYKPALRLAPTSYRPMQVESRVQSWRADDRRLHVDAFPSRPNRGERILRVFTNLNPNGEPRVWRVGEAFEDIARRFVPRAKPYVAWQAKALKALHVTKSLRTEYDHLMLQLHDGMKGDLDYQRSSPQVEMPFPPGSTWVCYSDQTSHAVMSGQFMMEQTLHLPAEAQVDRTASPLAILERQLDRRLT
ncbi:MULTISPECIES: Kdo hydroxylase family protein [unclassified Roseateles]|uniref:Kdo hydroxylase family protein n=1 Tax=Pelomonas sp. Root1237 TaxID=1736434 RepID=UPI0006FEFF9E|nr:Kdo hydroxylase family protein [Pelomonas sp. Root1237]KQV87573.1 3-deoxy-D-manno-oct-2-ulosonic acid (Kdo) hydroxylase [Pelomonas sp. Root1237]